MARYVALLRGVNNIGASKRVAMADLQALFEELGFRDVRTLLNSGNVVFSARRTASHGILARIRTGLARGLSLQASVILLSSREVTSVITGNPFHGPSVNPSALLVVVPPARRDLKRLQPLLKSPWAPEELALGVRAAYVWCANSVARSRLWPAVDRALARSATARNIATMERIGTALRYPPKHAGAPPRAGVRSGRGRR
ncbi:MAG TPA: DUF1697 domain-containing protein [Candidatus Saccharimonadales bacterium]|nr:DUF1697 domain-containing protein [Candidatus Saccharimonadales bacterium]